MSREKEEEIKRIKELHDKAREELYYAFQHGTKVTRMGCFCECDRLSGIIDYLEGRI